MRSSSKHGEVINIVLSKNGFYGDKVHSQIFRVGQLLHDGIIVKHLHLPIKVHSFIELNHGYYETVSVKNHTKLISLNPYFNAKKDVKERLEVNLVN